ncbi:PWWP domain-containing protein 2A [Xenopus laevis]|uniref:PWWP domain-containing protein 2A n=1 Tax=Xenopus laevis TaxID=8355 RepID=A0A8J1MR60_XENLA|nr:PWWP domain-containing protein 2A [Xenopus laevis]XP_041443926.1 PWWP domain-containing protein 2A [Xenopus laevis]
MAAVAAAPGPGEAGESEQDSKTTPGEWRLGELQCEPIVAVLDSERQSLIRCEMDSDTLEKAGPVVEQLGGSGTDQAMVCEGSEIGLGLEGKDGGEETMQVGGEQVVAPEPVEMESESSPDSIPQTLPSEQSFSSSSCGSAKEQECISEGHSQVTHNAPHPPQSQVQLLQMHDDVPQLPEHEAHQLQMHSNVLHSPEPDVQQLHMYSDVPQLPEPKAQQLQIHGDVLQLPEPKAQQLQIHGDVPQLPEPKAHLLQMHGDVPQLPQPEAHQLQMHSNVPQSPDTDVQQLHMYSDVPQLPEPKAQQLQIHADVPQLPEPKAHLLQMHGDVPQLPEPKAQQLQMHGDVPQLPEPKAQQLQMHSDVPQLPEPKAQQLQMHYDVPQLPKPKAHLLQMHGDVPQLPEPKAHLLQMHSNVPQLPVTDVLQLPEPGAQQLQMHCDVPQLPETKAQQLQMHCDVPQLPETKAQQLQIHCDVPQLPEPKAEQLQMHGDVPQLPEPKAHLLQMHSVPQSPVPDVLQLTEPKAQQLQMHGGVPQPPGPEVQHQEMYDVLQLLESEQEVYGDPSQPPQLEVQPLKHELDQEQKLVVQQEMEHEPPSSFQVKQVQDTVGVVVVGLQEHAGVKYKPLNGPVPEEFITRDPLSLGEKGFPGEALSVGDTMPVVAQSIGEAGSEEALSLMETGHGEALSISEECPGDAILIFNKSLSDSLSIQKANFEEVMLIETDHSEGVLPIKENGSEEAILSGTLSDQVENVAIDKLDTWQQAAGEIVSQEEPVPGKAKAQAATVAIPVIETVSGDVLAVQEPLALESLTQQKVLYVTPLQESGLQEVCAQETLPQDIQKNFTTDLKQSFKEAQEEPLSEDLHLKKVELLFQEVQNPHVLESCSFPQNLIPDDQDIKELVPECQHTHKPADVQSPVSGEIPQPGKEFSLEFHQQHNLESIEAPHNRLLPANVQISSETKLYFESPISEKVQKVHECCEEQGQQDPNNINMEVFSEETKSSVDTMCEAANLGPEIDFLSKSLVIPDHVSVERDHASPLTANQLNERNVSCFKHKETHSELCMTVDTLLETQPNKLDEDNTKNITCGLQFVFEKPELQPDQLSRDMATENITGSDPEKVTFVHELIPESVTEDTVINLGPNQQGTGVPGPTLMKTVYGIDKNSDFESVSVMDYKPPYRGINQERIAGENKKARHEQLPRHTFLQKEPTPMILSEVRDSGVHTEMCLEEATLSSNNDGSETSLNDPDCDIGSMGTSEGSVVTSGIGSLIPGSEVQVTLDHIIQDALVVSFCHGNRIFSGVLMDLSKRFGPHGIPVTVHPRREYKNKPVESIQEESKSFHEETLLKSEENVTPPEDVTPIQQSESCEIQNLWTTKPPPLFHEGAPYPPPLFIRDTYNQSIPQPPPRKIKRPKKKIYREEPTSIINAIKLRPRQVLCDKCKNNVVADKKEIRKVATDSYKTEEGKRRRHETITTVNKKLKTDHKVNGKGQHESQKRAGVTKVPNLAHGRGKVVKVPSQTSAAKTQLHTKKVLQNKNMDHVKAREVLKMAKEKAQKKQKVTTSSKNAHSKVHFTRRLQNSNSGTLPPRLRIKPQRYRNEENDSSLKPGLETLRSSKMGIKPQTRYSATRSAGEAPSEIQSPSNGPEEVSSEIQDTNVCVPPEEQDLQQTLGKRGSKSNITVYMAINQKKANSSSASVCSSDSTDDMKSSHSECSSTENFDFPPGSMHTPSSSSASSKEEKKLSNSLKIKMFSKNVSKCVTPDGRTICVGDIVWAKIYGFPWWPARILAITISRKDNGLLIRQEARISWFGSPTTSFLALSQLAPFLENFQSRFNKKRKGLYRKAITEAAKAAKQLTPEVRALLTQFET